MIKGIGVDLVDLRRLDPDKRAFVKRVLNPLELAAFDEIKSTKMRREYLGGRFAAKEAFLKTRKLGLGQMDLREIIILNDSAGAPYYQDPHTHLSITHDGDFAMAFAIWEE